MFEDFHLAKDKWIREHLGELDIHKSFPHCCFSLNNTEALGNMERRSPKELGGF